MWFRSSASSRRLTGVWRNAVIGNANVQRVDSVRRVHQDGLLDMHIHVTKTAQACFFQLRRLDVSDWFAAYLVVTWPPTWLLRWCSCGLTTATCCLLDYLISQSHHRVGVINVAVRLVNCLKQRLICTSYRQKHMSSISSAHWYTTLLPTGHLNTSPTFFSPSPPCHFVI